MLHVARAPPTCLEVHTFARAGSELGVYLARASQHIARSPQRIAGSPRRIARSTPLEEPPTAGNHRIAEAIARTQLAAGSASRSHRLCQASQPRAQGVRDRLTPSIDVMHHRFAPEKEPRSKLECHEPRADLQEFSSELGCVPLDCKCLLVQACREVSTVMSWAHGAVMALKRRRRGYTVSRRASS